MGMLAKLTDLNHVQVPLGVLPKQETVYEEMIDILEEYKRYVPSRTVKLVEPIPGSDATEDESYLTTLLGGDYLSVARARGAQCIRGSAELEKHRLNMFLATGEGWHAMVCFLEVHKSMHACTCNSLLLMHNYHKLRLLDVKILST